jgi:hypothetical protein
MRTPTQNSKGDFFAAVKRRQLERSLMRLFDTLARILVLKKEKMTAIGE